MYGFLTETFSLLAPRASFIVLYTGGSLSTGFKIDFTGPHVFHFVGLRAIAVKCGLSLLALLISRYSFLSYFFVSSSFDPLCHVRDSCSKASNSCMKTLENCSVLWMRVCGSLFEEVKHHGFLSVCEALAFDSFGFKFGTDSRFSQFDFSRFRRKERVKEKARLETRIQVRRVFLL